MYRLAMVIDDIDLHCELTKQIVRFHNFSEQTVCFTSARDALAALMSGAPFPDVIFLDLNMPDMNGFDFLDRFRDIPAEVSNNCAVYVLSVKIDSAEEERLKRYPVVKKLVHKPLTAARLKELL